MKVNDKHLHAFYLLTVLVYFLHFLNSESKLGWQAGKFRKELQALENWLYSEKLNKLCPFSLSKRRLRGNLIIIYKCGAGSS